MARPSYIFIEGFWERLDDEIYKQNRTKVDLAKQCGFDRKILIIHIVCYYIYMPIILFIESYNSKYKTYYANIIITRVESNGHVPFMGHYLFYNPCTK